MSIKNIIISSFLFLILINNVCSQEKMESIDNSIFFNKQRTSCIFFHEIHNEKAEIDDCSLCHHSYDEKGCKIWEDSSEDKSCHECHYSGNEFNLRKIFHIACNKCHKREKKGPLSCGNCHLNSKK